MNGIAELYRLRLAETIAAGDTTPMMVFPIGEWHSTLYPDLELTEDLANEMIANFEAGILGTEPVVDSSGKHDTSVPAAGWVKRVYLASYEEGPVTGLALWADVKWTGFGATMLSDDQYKYGSVEIGPVTLNDTGEKVENVLRSLTLTNTPVLRLMPGVKDAAAKQRVAVTLSLSEVTLAATPDPVASILDDMDALAAKLDAALKGKLGMPAIRTMLKEVRTKASAHSLAEAGSTNDQREALEQALSDAFGAMHEGLYVEDFGPDWVVFHTWSAGMAEGHYYRVTYSGTTFGQPAEVERDTTYVPVTDSSPAGAQPASSTALSQRAKAKEGHGAHLAEGDAAEKGVDPMKTVATKLNLAEDATEALVLAEVVKLTDHDAAETKRADTAELQLAETAKAKRDGEVAVELAEIENAGNLKPGEKAQFILEATEKPDVYAARLADRKALKQNTIMDKSVHGSGHEGDGDSTKRADVELYELATLKMAELKCDYAVAANLVLSENKGGVADRYRDLTEGREG